MVTLATTVEGFLLAAFGGVGLAVLFNQSRLLEYSLYPYAVILQVTPIVAIAPLLLIYLPQPLAVLACAWIVAFFPVLANTTLGLHSVDRNLGRLFQLLDELGLTEKTTILFTSDHGYMIGHHLLQHKGNAVWIAGGIVAMCGALTLAEVAGAFGIDAATVFSGRLA